jgi:aminoglycoside 6-adenylyltransferase
VGDVTSERPEAADVLARLERWAREEPRVRALVLESSRAQERAPLDAFSDYDVLVAVEDADAFAADETWPSAFGTPLVRFRDSGAVRGHTTYSRLVLYADGTKVDYLVWPAALLRELRGAQTLPEVLDWGCRPLVDKDGLTEGWPAPTRSAYIPRRPTEQEYYALVEEFWWETSYVAKNLWRDEVLFAKYNLEVVMKLDLLLRMLEWRIEIERDWMWKPGVLGRGMKQHLPAETWAELERTFVGPGIEENWQALFATTALFRRTAREVGAALGFAYPHELDAGMTAYLDGVREQARQRDEADGERGLPPSGA